MVDMQGKKERETPCIFALMSVLTGSMPQVSHRVCAVHGAELAIEMVTSERATLVCKHEKHLNSKSLYALTFEQI